MIKIGDRFEISRDKYQWLLSEWKDGVNPKTKEPTRTKYTTYHGTTKQVAQVMLARSIGNPTTLEELIDTFDRCTEEISTWINK